jgi:hypothetical protein
MHRAMREETVFFSSASVIVAIFCAISSNLSMKHPLQGEILN